MNQNQDLSIKNITIHFDVNEGNGIATAVLASADIKTTLSQTLIREMINNHKIANWDIHETAITDVLNKFKKGTQCRIVIAERKNASFRIILSDDRMNASIDAQPAYGGKPLSADELLTALNEKQVNTKRIDKAMLTHLTAITEPTQIVVAYGKAPTDGSDSVFQPLIEEKNQSNVPEEDDTGKVDFLAGKQYLSVEAGTPILKRIPPQPGQMGMDIYGQLIPSTSGKEIPFASDMPGTEISPEDPNVVLASVTGHPVFMPDGAKVDKMLTFKNIDLTTGHITFDGSIHIKGDVMPEMKINVTGDVFVKGAVERAHIIAGNDITVGGGILGDTQIDLPEKEELKEALEYECFLQAGGSVVARFINIANVKAQKDIVIKEYAFHAALSAGSNISIGQNGGKGKLVGGHSWAGHAVIAKALGSKAYAHTHIQVGATREELGMLQKIKFVRDQRINQAKILRDKLEKIKTTGATATLGMLELNKAKKIHETLVKIQKDLADLNNRMLEIKIAVFEGDDPNITATSNCYPNCFLVLNGAYMQTTQEHKAISFIKRGSQITAKK